jgi:hypothetical protein
MEVGADLVIGKNHLAYGVCRVSIGRSTGDFLTTLAWIDFVGESFQNVESGRGRWRNWQRS